MWQPILKCNPFVADSRVLIEASVLATIYPYRQTQAWKPESGGILLGFRRGNHLHVVEATAPYPGDEQQRFRFRRTSRPHQEHALRRWKNSGGTVDYLGEWHTHPEPHPHPSYIDLTAWRRIHTARQMPMLFMIAGLNECNWLGVGHRATLKSL